MKLARKERDRDQKAGQRVEFLNARLDVVPGRPLPDCDRLKADGGRDTLVVIERLLAHRHPQPTVPAVVQVRADQLRFGLPESSEPVIWGLASHKEYPTLS